MSVKRSKESQPAADFISFIHDWGHPEWVVLAAEGPIEEVSKQYAATSPARKHLANVPIKAALKSDDEIAPLVAIAQPAESAWTVIYRMLCLPIVEQDIKEAINEAQTLSAKLKTRALAFIGEDTSYSMVYYLYEKGKQIGTREWESQDDSSDAAFAKLGIYLPACYPRLRGEDMWLAALTSSVERIQRADIIDAGDA